MMGPLLGTTRATTTTTSAADLQRAPFTTPHQTVPVIDLIEPPPAPLRNKGSDLEVDNLALEGVAPELAPSDFVSQNYETLATLIQEETKKRLSQSLQARLNFDPEYKASSPRHRKETRESRIIPLECAMVSGPKAQPFDAIQKAKERIKMAIHLEYPEQTIAIGSTLTEEGRKMLCDLLRRNLDIFALETNRYDGDSATHSVTQVKRA
nr:reverse transcriptase domain-containing protein [Tanacetum cinerariifolium]